MPDAMPWYVQEKLRVCPPGTSCAAGAAVWVATPLPPAAVAVTAAAVACPALVTSRRNVRSCPVLACAGVSRATAVSAGGVWTVVGPALAAAETIAPLSLSLPLAPGTHLPPMKFLSWSVSNLCVLVLAAIAVLMVCSRFACTS